MKFGKAQLIFDGIENLRDESSWNDELSFAYARLDGVAERDEIMVNLSEGVRRCVDKLLSEYQRRIVGRLNEDPYDLLWLSYGVPSYACAERVRLAERLLGTGDDQLQIMGRKIKHEWRHELRECIASGGKVCPTLWFAWRVAAHSWVADTQELEGCMSLIKIAVAKRSQKISLPLLDATVANSKCLGVGTRASKQFKYSYVKPLVDNVVRDASEHITYAMANLDPLMFSTPLPFMGHIPAVRTDAVPLADG